MTLFTNTLGKKSIRKFHGSPALVLIYVAGFLRSLGVGLLGVILAIYLARVGLSATRIGIVIGVGLLGACSATALISWASTRIDYRKSLATVSLLAVIGGVGLAVLPSFAVLLMLVFVGMVNGMGTDRSASFALEQALVPSLVPHTRRTWALAWYNVLLDGGGALGAAGAVLPVALARWEQMELARAYQCVFVGYAVLQVVIACIYLLLPTRIGFVSTNELDVGGAISSQSRKVVQRIAALFAMDAFAGGFLTDALVAYWFFGRFGLEEQALAMLFFTVHIFNAVSHLGAAWLAQRIGLVNTMVFTHLPSSLLLIAVPFASSPPLAIALFLLRETFVEMDVPTRQSYIAALVKSHERAYASGITNLTRTGGWAIASSVSGWVMQRLAFSAPLFIGGSLKIVYDLLLYRNFRRLKPPEEVAGDLSAG
jgi:MFS family permease